MSALPHDADRKQPGRKSGLLVEALQSEAAARLQVSANDARIRQAMDESAEELVYRWQTPDQREAEMRIYYHRREDIDLLAVELVQIDYRQPTHQERAQYEDDFQAELAAAADLWLEVCSHLAG